MQIELSTGEKITLRQLSWGEENDCYEVSEVSYGVMKNCIFERQLELRMTCKLSPEDKGYVEELIKQKNFINKLNRDDGLKLREAAKSLFKGDSKGDQKN